MSTNAATIHETGLRLDKKIEGVSPTSYYDDMDNIIMNLIGNDAGDSEKEESRRIVVSNYVYLIYERVVRNVIRDIDYEQVRKWGGENMKLAMYLLKKKWGRFPFEAYEKWVAPDLEIMPSCGMYTRANKLTKNFYH